MTMTNENAIADGNDGDANDKSSGDIVAAANAMIVIKQKNTVLTDEELAVNVSGSLAGDIFSQETLGNI